LAGQRLSGFREKEGIDLAYRFIGHNGNGIGQIVASGMFAWHRDPVKKFLIAFVEFFRKARCLVAKDKIVPKLEGKIPIGLSSASAGKEEPVRLFLMEKRFPVGMHIELEMFPVVQSRPFHLGFLQRKG